MHAELAAVPSSLYHITRANRVIAVVRHRRIAVMNYNIAYHCHCELRLDSGRGIFLDRLTQSRVYAGLLEGTPNRASNDRTIQGILERARQVNDWLGDPYLIDPQRRDYLREPGDMQSVIDRQDNRPLEMKRSPEWLPQIACVGVFRSSPPVRDKSKDASSLTIVWFQDDFGLDPRALEQLRSIDWVKHATDWEY